MAKESPEERLKEFGRNPSNRRIGEWLGLLRLFGWDVKPAKKEGYKCQRGPHTMTLPEPHGSDPVVKLPYAKLILRMIDAGNADEESQDDE